MEYCKAKAKNISRHRFIYIESYPSFVTNKLRHRILNRLNNVHLNEFL